MKKKPLIYIISFLSLQVTAHSGGTDSSGGHYDRKNGEYHFHHGRRPHQHENGECAFDIENNSNFKWYLLTFSIGVIGYKFYESK